MVGLLCDGLAGIVDVAERHFVRPLTAAGDTYEKGYPTRMIQKKRCPEIEFDRTSLSDNQNYDP
jgi:hypothetical protein